jgi:Cu/Ag efflux pump CusA
MAVSVIGGLITSTFLSLLVIPAVYLYVDDLGKLFGRLAGLIKR